MSKKETQTVSSLLISSMDCTSKKIINFIFSVSFIVHLSYLSFNIINPLYPVIEEYQTKLEDIEFPIVFKICLSDAGDNASVTERYEAVGYGDVDLFFAGDNKYDDMYGDKIYGWSGFYDNETSMDINGKK